MLKTALIGATLALALLPATRSEAQTQPHTFPVTAASGNVAAAPAAATLPGAPGLTTFISGFEITASGATAASCVNATVAGVVSGSLTLHILRAGRRHRRGAPAHRELQPGDPGGLRQHGDYRDAAFRSAWAMPMRPS